MYYWHANCTKIVGTCLMTHNFLSLQFVFIIEYARGTAAPKYHIDCLPINCEW